MRRDLVVGFACLCVAIVGVALPVRGEEPSSKIIPDVVYGHKDGLAMTMDVYYPTGTPNGAAVVFMVSGGWYSKWAPPESMFPIFQPYLDAGFTMMAVRHGSSPRYSIPEAVSDVRQAIRFIHLHAADWSVDPARLGVLGMSAGGHLALMLGTTGEDAASEKPANVDHASSRVRAVVALVPPTDLRVAVWDAPESLPAYRGFPALDLSLDKAKEYSPLVHVTKDDAPALVIMGGQDELVPPRHGEWIDAAYQREQVPHKLVIFEGEGHGLGMNNEENRQRLNNETVEWFKNHLSQ